jgi:hypothetical protein
LLSLHPSRHFQSVRTINAWRATVKPCKQEYDKRMATALQAHKQGNPVLLEQTIKIGYAQSWGDQAKRIGAKAVCGVMGALMVNIGVAQVPLISSLAPAHAVRQPIIMIASALGAVAAQSALPE